MLEFTRPMSPLRHAPFRMVTTKRIPPTVARWTMFISWGVAATAVFAAAEPDPLHSDLNGWYRTAAIRDELRTERAKARSQLPPSLAASKVRSDERRVRPVELFLFAYDTSFYDRTTRRYRIDALLDEGEREFGGYDQILLWQPYPRFGLCPRSASEVWEDMPGGLPALRDVIARCHARGVTVLLNYIRWDATGVARDWPQDAPEDFAAQGRELARLLAATGADGVFGDTLKGCPPALRAALDELRPGLIYEGEYAPDPLGLSPSDESWTQGLKPSPLRPSRLRWLAPQFQWRFVERGTDRHDWMVAQAMFWGSGVLVWENVFGWWNPYQARARAFLRRAAPLLRAHADAFADPDWEPLEAELAPGVHGQRWQAGEKRVITLLNENEAPATVEVPLPSEGDPLALAVHDAWNGVRLTPAADGRTVTVTLEGRAPGVLILQPAAAPPPVVARPYRAFDSFAEGARRRVMDAQEPGTQWIQISRRGVLRNERYPADASSLLVEETGYRTRVTAAAFAPRPVAAAPLAPAAGANAPAGMVPIAGGRFIMQVKHQARWREGGCYHHPNETSHSAQSFWLAPFYLDRCAVSRAEYQRFLAATGYLPADAQNFLRDWTRPHPSDTRTWEPPSGTASWPVTWIDLDDARAYAAWAGKRLPREEEWQFAAQGTDGRPWPWGQQWDPARCHHGHPTPSPVDAYPQGASPFGCLGMVGNVWEWTESERDDGHTRYAILRGGSHFTVPTSYWGKMWYAAEGAQPCDAHEKIPLLAPGLDRSANFGFRCAADVEL
jgi:gamma-glutamyl hercynylcysteine S-oxide synthase